MERIDSTKHTLIRFGEVDEDGDMFMPGCFDTVDDERPLPVYHNFNHSRLIGKAVVSQTQNALEAEIELTLDGAAQVIKGGSNQSHPTRIAYREIKARYEQGEDGKPIRVIEKARLMCVSIVGQPKPKEP